MGDVTSKISPFTSSVVVPTTSPFKIPRTIHADIGGPISSGSLVAGDIALSSDSGLYHSCSSRKALMKTPVTVLRNMRIAQPELMENLEPLDYDEVSEGTVCVTPLTKRVAKIGGDNAFLLDSTLSSACWRSDESLVNEQVTKFSSIPTFIFAAHMKPPLLSFMSACKFVTVLAALEDDIPEFMKSKFTLVIFVQCASSLLL